MLVLDSRFWPDQNVLVSFLATTRMTFHVTDVILRLLNWHRTSFWCDRLPRTDAGRCWGQCILARPNGPKGDQI
jgi:hypothetical protein